MCENVEKTIIKGLEEFKLKRIYWCVSPDNKRAVRFYDKNGCERVSIDQLYFEGGYRTTTSALYLVSKNSLNFVKGQLNRERYNFICFILDFVIEWIGSKGRIEYGKAE